MSELDTKSILHGANSQLLLRQVLLELHQQQHLQLDQLINVYQEIQGDRNIPISVFSGKQNPAEALCLFLKENQKLSFPKISEILNRDPKSVWGTYQRAKRRSKKRSVAISDKYTIPLQLFHDRSKSLLEHVVFYLHQVHQLTNPQITKLLHRSPNSIAVLYKRAREKQK